MLHTPPATDAPDPHGAFLPGPGARAAPHVALGVRHEALAPAFARAFPWTRWETRLAARGVTLDRPRGSRHPAYPAIVYPIDYGYANGTSSGDGEAVDVFVGTAPALGLVGAILTRDFRRLDREVKLLWNTHPEEIYRAHGFLNFDRALLDGTLALRYPMAELWRRAIEISAP